MLSSKVRKRCICWAAIALQALAVTNCAGVSKYPKVLTSEQILDNSNYDDNWYYAITGTDEAIYIGGFIGDWWLIQDGSSDSEATVIARIDVASAQQNWNVSY